MNKFYLIIICVLFNSFFVRGQVISWSPEFPSIHDTITITYNSSLGNGALANTNTIYAHTGVINKYSSSMSDWKNTPVEWHEGADSIIQLTSLGGSLFQIKFHIKSYYGILNTDKVRYLNFVFRNANGNISGRNIDGSEFFIPIFDSSETVRFTKPLDFPFIRTLGDNINIQIRSKQNGMINLFRNGVLISQNYGDSLAMNFSTQNLGKHYLHYEMQSAGVSYTDSIYYIVEGPQVVQDPPSGAINGINYINDSTVVLVLEAPFKDFVYVIGDWNNWEIDPNFRMNKSQNGEKYWIEINGLTPNVEYLFQYFVDASIKIADPYSRKVISEYDQYIPNSVYPNLISYPHGKTTHEVSVIETNKQEYNWQTQNFTPPDSRDLVIYELLIRDFSYRSDYQTVIDSLSHLKKLGVNAIQLMPIIEFDGLLSWGYAPTFFFAAEKFYGPEETLKALIDSCHSNDIAVILDIVFNHAFQPNPWLRLYYDKGRDEPTSQSPWFNNIATHPFNVGYDFNHSSPLVHAMVDSVLDYWTSEFKFDGYRFDLSKGFTQFNSLGNVGLWSNYDWDRINNIKRIATNLWQNHPGKYVILEHFAENSEEMELSAHGCMLWGKGHNQYNESTMGYVGNGGDDFEWSVSKNERGWTYHNLVGFMESHDEERLMYNNMLYGNSSGTYNVKDLETSLKRMGQAAAFFFTVPGPKLMWQFGELGYDYSINFPSNTSESRTAPKPVKWDYKNDYYRYNLFLEYSALIKLKINYPAFRTSDYRMETWGTQKQIYIDDPQMNAVVIGNFNVVEDDTYTGFQHTGWWYDYITGDSINVTDVHMTIDLNPGDWKIFTDIRLDKPNMSNPIDTSTILTNQTISNEKLNIYPNPFSESTQISFEGNGVATLIIFDNLGREVNTQTKICENGQGIFDWDGTSSFGQKLKTGFYPFTIKTDHKLIRDKIFLTK